MHHAKVHISSTLHEIKLVNISYRICVLYSTKRYLQLIRAKNSDRYAHGNPILISIPGSCEIG